MPPFTRKRVLRGQGRTTKEGFLKIVKGLVLATGFTAALGVAAPGFAGGNKYATDTVQQECTSGSDTDYVIFKGPVTLWPPNHKWVAEAITAQGDQGDSVSIGETITPTDAAGGDGGPQHDPDWTPANGQPATTGTTSATVNFSLRAERSGRGVGRTYTIDWVANFGNHSCASSTSSTDQYVPFVVTVPHDMRDKNN